MKRMISPSARWISSMAPFEPLLEFAAEARSSHHGPQVELYHLLAAEDLGHVVLGDLAGQPFGDGRLAHTGLADEHRVVLGPAAEHLDHAQDLCVAPDDRIQFAFAGQLGQVAAELFQGAVAALGLRAGDLLATANLFDDLQDAAACHPDLCQDAGRRRVSLAGNGQEEMFGGDIVILQLGCFFIRLVDHALEPGCDVHLPHTATVDLGAGCASQAPRPVAG